MSTNTGVIILSSQQLNHADFSTRLDIEDNIGEGIHIHYKNMRLDYTIKEFLEFSEACKKALRTIE